MAALPLRNFGPKVATIFCDRCVLPYAENINFFEFIFMRGYWGNASGNACVFGIVLFYFTIFACTSNTHSMRVIAG